MTGQWNAVKGTGQGKGRAKAGQGGLACHNLLSLHGRAVVCRCEVQYGTAYQSVLVADVPFLPETARPSSKWATF